MTGKEAEDNRDEGGFTSGVVEGFYGRPWSTEQRKLLFSWMNKMGLNTYMYAPKDDCKHRAFWRDLYSVEEAENLTGLIDAAFQSNVTFVYAVSPGLDISFSSTKDIQFLKRKLEQVAAFGCKAFAVLFDDIDPELSEADKSMFQSFAYAQVSIANEVYEHLRQPKFLFCPTEYCATRALPNVSSSDYLTTIGAKLLPGIDIMWTGPKVVSKRISIQSLEEVASVLKRPPIIWDNIHANDYDPRRLFLGPYDGRSPEIIPYIKGVLTNPNCEFEVNYVACHTLAQWCKSNVDGVKKDIISSDRLSPIASDIKLETESDFGSDSDIPSFYDSRYRPRQALKVALNEWILEFAACRLPPKRPAPPILPPTGNVNACLSVPGSLNPEKTILPAVPPMDSAMSEVDNASFLQPAMMPVNSLLDVPVSDTDSAVDSAPELEPMDCVPSPVMSGALPENHPSIPKNSSSESLMQVEIATVDKTCDKSVDTDVSVQNSGDTLACHLTHDDLNLLVDLFYMPFEHGSKGIQMLQDLHWLRLNAHSLIGKDKMKSEVKSWFEVAKRFEESVDCVIEMTDRLFSIPNKSLLNDLFPYVWDLKGVLQLCSAYIKWIGLGRVPYLSVCHMQGSFTWYTKGYKEAFLSGDQEPWVFRGGLQAEFQRMLPIDAAHDLFFMKPPDYVVKKKYVFRPYIYSDKASVYGICLKTCDDGMDGTDVFPEFPNLIGDRLLGSLVTNSSEYCFVVEDEEGVCGYALASLDAKVLHQNTKMSWMPLMCERYPKPKKEDLSPADEVIMSFHNEQTMIPDSLFSRYPSVLRLDILPGRMDDPAVPKRLLACALSALKTNGSIGVHCELTVGDKYLIDMYAKLGFFPIADPACVSEEIIYLGRII